MDHRNTSDSQENTQKKSSNRLATAALIFSLLMTPTIENGNATVSAQDTSKSTQTEQVEPTKHVNTMSTEQLIKKSVRATFKKIKYLSDLPKTIEYPGFDPNNLPQSIDIEPKFIADTITGIPFITVTLGDGPNKKRTFTLTPDFGNIKNITLTPTGLILKTTFATMNYDRQEKLPHLLRMLWTRPRGKGLKHGFRLTTVKEL
ncbi:MAG: hypothetical protein WCO66_04800 [Candidatus Absconditabacteria bacterium]